MSWVKAKFESYRNSEVTRLQQALDFVVRLEREPTKLVDYSYETLSTRFLSAFSPRRDELGMAPLYMKRVPLEVTYVAHLENADAVLRTLNDYFDALPKPLGTPSPSPYTPRIMGFVKDEDGNCGFAAAFRSLYYKQTDGGETYVTRKDEYDAASYLAQIKYTLQADLKAAQTMTLKSFANSCVGDLFEIDTPADVRGIGHLDYMAPKPD